MRKGERRETKMRKFFSKYLPASLLLVFLAMILWTCGGGGGGGGGDSATLTGLAINGPSSVNESSTATYAATASWSDGSTSSVTPSWAVNPETYASCSAGGVLTTLPVPSDQTVFVAAAYTDGGITETDTMEVTILGGGVTTSTFTGTVSGTLVLAVDENGSVAAQDDTTGKTPDTDGHYPFSLSVPSGHEYTIYFIVTTEDRIVPLFSGTTNIFSVTGGGTIDLGYVDTTQAEATCENDPLANAGVTDGGATLPNTISMQGSNPRLILIDRQNHPFLPDVGRKYRTQVAVKNPDGSVLTDGALVKDVVVYGVDWQELPQDGNFYYWDGLSGYGDSGSGPNPAPSSDIEAYLAAIPGDLPDGFYTEVITDSNGNLHMVKFWHEQPTEVDKPTNLAQVVNPDGSITLSWTNPAGIAGPEYNLRLEIRYSDENGDGLIDHALGVGFNTSTNSYTIPASFVSSNLAGKQELIWRVQVRQQVGPILFPDGTSRNAEIYRNYSANQALSVSPPLIVPQSGEWGGAVIEFYVSSDSSKLTSSGSTLVDNVGPYMLKLGPFPVSGGSGACPIALSITANRSPDIPIINSSWSYSDGELNISGTFTASNMGNGSYFYSSFNITPNCTGTVQGSGTWEATPR